MRPEKPVNLTIRRGTTYRFKATLTNPDGTPMNLTGYTAHLMIGTDIDYALTITPLTGVLAKTIAAATTAAWEWTGSRHTKPWYVRLTNPAGEVDDILVGRVTLEPY